MSRLLALSVLTVALLGGPASAGPGEGGYSSENVAYVRFVPFEAGTATGASLFDRGRALVVTSWRSFSIYELDDHRDPELVVQQPIGFKFENEDVATDGKIMLFSEEAPGDALHVWDIEDRSSPVEIATVEGAGDHTTTCLLGCRYSYGSDGSIVDLRNPDKAKLAGNWHRRAGIQQRVHDVDEFRRGFVVVSAFEGPMHLIDVRRPLRPRVVVSAAPPDLGDEAVAAGANVHATRWPRRGSDRFLMGQGGSNLSQVRCDNQTRNFWVWDASRWKSHAVLRLKDEYTPGNRTPDRGSYPVSTCSTHWFEAHPTFRNGGDVALAYYDMGTRFLSISSKGKIRERGWFLPYGGVTSAVYWVNDEIVYSIDYSRGFDILRFRRS